MSATHLIRRTSKWIGFGFCLFIVVAWGASVRRCLTYARADSRWRTEISCGRVRVAYGGSAREWSGWSRWTYTSLDGMCGRARSIGLEWPARRTYFGSETAAVDVPFWLLFLVSAIPSAILFRLSTTPVAQASPLCRSPL